MPSYGPCLCGATDCPSCGPAQGYRVVRIWKKGRYRWINLEDDEEEEPEEDFDLPDHDPIIG